MRIKISAVEMSKNLTVDKQTLLKKVFFQQDVS